MSSHTSSGNFFQSVTNFQIMQTSSTTSALLSIVLLVSACQLENETIQTARPVMSPTSRAAQFRFTFPETDSAYILLDGFDEGSMVRILPQQQRRRAG